MKRHQMERNRENEMQRRKELQIMAEVERERRKQHMVLVRALESHKKHEERERKREEILAEKRALHEKKLQKKRLEMELLKELRKPVDDLILKDLKPLPTLNRIPGLKLPAKAFSDMLMVYEFLHNFGETLGFDMESLPSLNTLQSALLNIDESAEEDLLSIIHHLLVCAIDDPGLPMNISTIMGQKLKDAPITNYNISEILRLYFQSFENQYRTESKTEAKMHSILNTGKPFLALNASHKAEILAFLCNELLSNQAIVKQVDESLELVANLRKDKWLVENDLRKFRTIRQRREVKLAESSQEESKKSEEDHVADDDSGQSDAEEMHPVHVHETEEEAGLSAEELDKKIENLQRKCTLATNKLNRAIHGMRVTSIGQDRYHRRYWALPSAGGVFVEGIESGEPEELENNISNGTDNEDEEEDEDEEECEDTIDEKDDVSESEEQTMEIDTELKTESITDANDSTESIVHKDEEMTECKEIKMEDGPSDLDSKMKKDLEVKPETKEIKSDKDVKKSENSWLSPIMASVLAGSMMFGGDSQNNGPNSSFPFQNLGLSLNAGKTGQSQNSWFSILPRMPCHKDTITSPVNKTNKNEPEVKLEEVKVEKKEKASPDHQENVAGLPSNFLMHAFLYPQILNSIFNQNKLTGAPCPPDSSPFSIDPSLFGLTSIKPNLQKLAKTDKSSLSIQDDSKSAIPTRSSTPAKDLIEIEICPLLQKRIQDQKDQEYKLPLKIPAEYQRGWWRLTDSSQLRSLNDSLHERGVREKHLHKNICKYLNYLINSCKSSAAELDITDMDSEILDECDHGAPENHDDSDWNKDVALRFDRNVLEQIENLEEKIAGSSMQIRGWRPSPRVSSDSTCDFIANKYEINLYTFSELVSGNDDPIADSLEFNDEDLNPVKLGRERLLGAEAVIERRYLKPPLGFKSNTILVSTASSLNDDEYAENAADENAPSGLLRWRDAVRECKSGSQLALLLHFLESCIAWDKSIMRAVS